MLLFLTGARRNEVTQAEWSYIDWQRSTLFVPKSKNGQPRYIQLNSTAIELLKSVPRADGNQYIFPALMTGRPMPQVFFPWDRIRKRAELNDLRLHDLRHSFAKFPSEQAQRTLRCSDAPWSQELSYNSAVCSSSQERRLWTVAEAVTDILKELDGL